MKIRRTIKVQIEAVVDVEMSSDVIDPEDVPRLALFNAIVQDEDVRRAYSHSEAVYEVAYGVSGILSDKDASPAGIEYGHDIAERVAVSLSGESGEVFRWAVEEDLFSENSEGALNAIKPTLRRIDWNVSDVSETHDV